MDFDKTMWFKMEKEGEVDAQKLLKEVDIDKEIEAEKCLKMSSEELLKLGIVDEIIKEPNGGGHTDVIKMSSNIKSYLIKELKSLEHITKKTLVMRRHSKFRHIRSEATFL